jgi:hypothetical protein
VLFLFALLSLLCDCWPVVDRRQSSNNDKNTNKIKPQQSKNSMPPTRVSHAARGPVCLKKRMGYAQWPACFEITYGVIDEANYALPS